MGKKNEQTKPWLNGSTFSEKYPTRNLDNIHCGIQEVKQFNENLDRDVDTGIVLVDDNHPIMELFDYTLKTLDQGTLSEVPKVLENKYPCDSESIKKLMLILVRYLERDLKQLRRDDWEQSLNEEGWSHEAVDKTK